MDTQAVNKAFATDRGDDAESGDMAFEWTVDDVVRSIRTRDGAPHRARRWMVAFGALAVAVAAIATIGLSADDAATAPVAVAPPARIAAAAPGNIAPRGGTLPVVAAAPGNIQPRGQTVPVLAAAHGPGSRGRAIVVVMPADRDYVAAASIPVAGLAFGRPHGPRVSCRPRRAVRRRPAHRGHGPRRVFRALRRGARPRWARRARRRRAAVQRPGQPRAGRRDPVDQARRAVGHALNSSPTAEAVGDREPGWPASAPVSGRR